MKIYKNKKIGEVSCVVKVDVKLTLWAAIKIRIAGINNLLKEEK